MNRALALFVSVASFVSCDGGGSDGGTGGGGFSAFGGGTGAFGGGSGATGGGMQAPAGCAAGTTCEDASEMGDFACLDLSTAEGFPASARDCSSTACPTGSTCWMGNAGSFCLQDCVRTPTGGGSGGASGGGSGGGGGGGAAVGGGAGGGGASGNRCRTYATQFSIDITGGEHTVTNDTAFFDVNTLTYTHSWTAMTANSTTSSTETSVFNSVADFVDVASGLMEGLGGPRSTELSFNGGGSFNTLTYDPQRRLTGYSMVTTVQGSSFTAAAFTITQWDNQGRVTSGTLDVGSPLPSERCSGMVLTFTRDDAARTSNVVMSGGVNSSQFGIDNCNLVNTDNTYDENLILVRAVHHNPAPHPPIVTDATTVQSTATVCY